MVWRLVHIIQHLNKFLLHLTMSTIFLLHPVANTHCDLGIILSSNLLWKEHYTIILTKAYWTYVIRRTFSTNLNIYNITNKIPTTILLPTVAFSLTPRYYHPWTTTMSLYQVYAQWLPIRLQNTSNQTNMLPLMYYYHLSNILLFIKSVKFPSSHFNINK